jgi:hypothetical protein
MLIVPKNHSPGEDMKTRVKLKPGQKGTKRLTGEYGDSLVCVRYRYDAETGKGYETAEIVVSEAD